MNETNDHGWCQSASSSQWEGASSRAASGQRDAAHVTDNYFVLRTDNQVGGLVGSKGSLDSRAVVLSCAFRIVVADPHAMRCCQIDTEIAIRFNQCNYPIANHESLRWWDKMGNGAVVDICFYCEWIGIHMNSRDLSQTFAATVKKRVYSTVKPLKSNFMDLSKSFTINSSRLIKMAVK